MSLVYVSDLELSVALGARRSLKDSAVLDDAIEDQNQANIDTFNGGASNPPDQREDMYGDVPRQQSFQGLNGMRKRKYSFSAYHSNRGSQRRPHRVDRSRRGSSEDSDEVPPLGPVLRTAEKLPIAYGGLSEYFISELYLRSRKSSGPDPVNPPASTYAIDQLRPSQADGAEACAICQSLLLEGSKEMPCSHCFHEQCITDWLQIHNTCPCCRCEVESCNPRYNRRHHKQMKGEVREEAMTRPEGDGRQWVEVCNVPELMQVVSESGARCFMTDSTGTRRLAWGTEFYDVNFRPLF